MKKKIDPKSILRQAGKQPVDEPFLKSFREDLVSYMELNPALPVMETAQPRITWSKWLASAGALALLLGTGTVFAAQGSLPGDPLYPVKLATENVQVATTLDAKAKADLQLSLVKKRVEEIQAVLARPSSTPSAEKNLTPALQNLEDNSGHVSAFAAKLHDSGDDKEALKVAQALHVSVSAFVTTDTAATQTLQILGNIQKESDDQLRNLFEDHGHDNQDGQKQDNGRHGKRNDAHQENDSSSSFPQTFLEPAPAQIEDHDRSGENTFVPAPAPSPSAGGTLSVTTTVGVDVATTTVNIFEHSGRDGGHHDGEGH